MYWQEPCISLVKDCIGKVAQKISNDEDNSWRLTDGGSIFVWPGKIFDEVYK